MAVWTTEEDNILKENYEQGKWDVIFSALPNRSHSAIVHRANRLGLSQDRQWKKRSWTEEEEEILREHYPNKPQQDLMKLLPNRSWGEITLRASRLHLKREINFYYDTDEPLQLSEVDKGYIAGVLDGEGSIGLQKVKGRKGQQEFRPRIYIANTNLAIIKRCAKILGLGNEAIHNRFKGRWKPIYALNLSKLNDTYRLLQNILPYLEKRRQAELLMEFMKMKLHSKRKIIRDSRGRIRGVEPAPVPNRVYEIYEELRKLNKRGGEPNAGTR